jgi:hypothetical protein
MSQGTPIQKCVQALQQKMAMFGKKISVNEATKQCMKKFSEHTKKTTQLK